MDTERYQALMDTLEMAKSRAEEAQEALRSEPADEVVVHFYILQLFRYADKAKDEATEVFRDEEESA